MKLEKGMRVRAAGGFDHGLIKGNEYLVVFVDPIIPICTIAGSPRWYGVDCFKPLIRVKAPCVPSLDLHVKRATAAFHELSPEEQVAHWQAQRESWARSCVEFD